MLDSQLLFSNNQAITGSAASTNVIDQLVARDIGVGGEIMLQVYCTQTFLTLTSLQIALQGSPDNLNWYDFLDTPVIPVADLVTGTHLWKVTFPPRGWLLPSQTPVEYYRLNYTVAGSNATAGKITAYLSAANDQDNFYAYPNNYTA